MTHLKDEISAGRLGLKLRHKETEHCMTICFGYDDEKEEQ
jgi:hypothetical protein